MLGETELTLCEDSRGHPNALSKAQKRQLSEWLCGALPTVEGWFGSNNIARLSDEQTDMGFLYAFLSTPYGRHQLTKDIYGGVVDHINESHIGDVLVPKVPHRLQSSVGDLVRRVFACKDEANHIEDKAIEELETLLRKG